MTDYSRFNSGADYDSAPDDTGGFGAGRFTPPGGAVRPQLAETAGYVEAAASRVMDPGEEAMMRFGPQNDGAGFVDIFDGLDLPEVEDGSRPLATTEVQRRVHRNLDSVLAAVDNPRGRMTAWEHELGVLLSGRSSCTKLLDPALVLNALGVEGTHSILQWHTDEERRELVAAAEKLMKVRCVDLSLREWVMRELTFHPASQAIQAIEG